MFLTFDDCKSCIIGMKESRRKIILELGGGWYAYGHWTWNGKKYLDKPIRRLEMERELHSSGLAQVRVRWGI